MGPIKHLGECFTKNGNFATGAGQSLLLIQDFGNKNELVLESNPTFQLYGFFQKPTELFHIAGFSAGTTKEVGVTGSKVHRACVNRQPPSSLIRTCELRRAAKKWGAVDLADAFDSILLPNWFITSPY